jgi:hypothetical protein
MSVNPVLVLERWYVVRWARYIPGPAETATERVRLDLNRLVSSARGPEKRLHSFFVNRRVTHVTELGGEEK